MCRSRPPGEQKRTCGNVLQPDREMVGLFCPMTPFPFDYDLPPDLIAQEPCEPRDHARLLVARRSDYSLQHRRFDELPTLLESGDLLVSNDTRVLPARLLGRRSRTGGKWEGLFLRELPDATWEMLCQTRGSLQDGEIIEVKQGPLRLELLCRLSGGRWTVTQHVGLATFQPIQVDDYRRHPMHAEWGQLPQPAVDAIYTCKARGGRVVAVGTTSVRVLENVARLGPLHAWSGETELFLYPPCEFKVIDALVTNFHLPRTTLLLLATAFAGVDLLQKAYDAAIAERYRFYSYGDAMLIV
jgi:S-adenosylmethionine:tRNA-ribosyltransferase-isomerase (queuine synthetase)